MNDVRVDAEETKGERYNDIDKTKSGAYDGGGCGESTSVDGGGWLIGGLVATVAIT